jgi:SAM-dependent methyltransferase
MGSPSEKIQAKLFKRESHPYRILEREIENHLAPHHVFLDAGCGRSAEVLARFRGKASCLVGIDLVDFNPGIANGDLKLMKGDLTNIQLGAGCVDLVSSRSVLEHLSYPLRVYQEMFRILKPGGHFIALTPNLWDYASLLSKLIPNRLHPWIVRMTEGRDEKDTFPAYYRSNTSRSIHRLARQSGFDVVSLKYLGQYPSYFRFNRALFLVAAAYEKLISRYEFLKYFRGWLLAVLRKP